MMDLWQLFVRPHRISEVSEPLKNEEAEQFEKARREFEETFEEFQRERESWRRKS